MISGVTIGFCHVFIAEQKLLPILWALPGAHNSATWASVLLPLPSSTVRFPQRRQRLSGIRCARLPLFHDKISMLKSCATAWQLNSLLSPGRPVQQPPSLCLFAWLARSTKEGFLPSSEASGVAAARDRTLWGVVQGHVDA